MNKYVFGILAHVDAGKTTLSEALLYKSQSIRTLGRVDERNTFLDTETPERQRGITVYLKQAILKKNDITLTLIDTPGHVDFYNEVNKSLSILDFAVLVINGAEGVQAHTKSIYEKLIKNGIPFYIFVNKTDLSGFNKVKILNELVNEMGPGCIDFTNLESSYEQIASLSEDLMEKYFNSNKIEYKNICSYINKLKLHPVFFGSALKLSGIDAFLDSLFKYNKENNNIDSFGAKVFKIGVDAKGNRLTYLKITGGNIKVKDNISYIVNNEEINEKVNQIRIYNGEKFESKSEVSQGDVCAILGLNQTYIGQGLGFETDFLKKNKPVLSYCVSSCDSTDNVILLQKLRLLEEESPQLNVTYIEALNEIRVSLMGKVDTEVFINRVYERFGISVKVDNGKILYKETIAKTINGAGHFEPLRHYAEVHLRLDPLPRGLGLVFDSECSEDILSRNWQRLILTHLEEKVHIGVITGSPITDMKITLISGRAHPKHTEGGDFRQATYRAIRQALMKAENILLEPYVNFKIEVPMDSIGRVISDLTEMGANLNSPMNDINTSYITGSAPLEKMIGYEEIVSSFTHGLGKTYYEIGSYDACKNPMPIVNKISYDPISDINNTADSVFCSHGSGTIIPWNLADQYMHISDKGEKLVEVIENKPSTVDEKELKAIFAREFAPPRVINNLKKPEIKETAKIKDQKYEKTYLIIDGYNLIFSNENFKSENGIDINSAREKLLDILVNYSSYRDIETIVVFDAYKVSGNSGKSYDYINLHVHYTSEGESGDMYIERLIHEIGKNNRIKVVTSDWLIQLSTLTSGMLRMSSQELWEDIKLANIEINKNIKRFAN